MQADAAGKVGRLLGLVAMMRPKQWVKNLFVFAPLIFARKFLHEPAIMAAAAAFLLFCLASSAVYVVNDLCDVERDRRHPTKRFTRPIAAGLVSPTAAMLLLALLCLLIAAAWWRAPGVVYVIGAYLALNVAYSLGLKHQPVVDLFCVALGFVLRILAGAEAIAVPLSNWMAVTTLCLALYLAAVKRRQELAESGAPAREVLRLYSVGLVDRYAQIAATAALVFYGLFVVTTNDRLAGTVPLVIFGLFRYWYVVDHSGSGESPTDSLLADWPLVLTVLCWATACMAALWPR
jgi:decaprenyl-phosphate phosphoribosyltransferase